MEGVATILTIEIFADAATEWRALGALLDDKNAEWMNRISPGLFTADRVDAFHAMQRAYVKHGEITYEGIKANNSGKVPGQISAAQGGNIRAIVDELVRLAKKRQAARVGAELKNLANEHDPSIDKIQSALILDPILAEEDSSLAPGAQELLADLHLKQSGAYQYVRSGLNFIDLSLGGEWKPRSAISILAPSGTGKTTLVAQSMLNMALGYVNEITGEKITTPSLFFSLEMAKSDLIIKWLGNTLNIDTRFIQAGKLTKQQFDLIERKTVELQQLPMYVIDNPALTLGQYVYEIRKHVYRYGVRVVFLDYLQLVNHGDSTMRSAELGEFAQAMKALAKRENITIVLLSQVTEDNGKLKTRWSGDVVPVVDAEFQLTVGDDEFLPPGYKAINVNRTKNRFGPTGQMNIVFNGAYQRFEESTENV